MAVTTSSNSTLSADIVEAILVKPLAQKSEFLNVGVPVYASDGNPVHLPTLTSIGTATSFVAEGSEIPEASVATSEAVLLDSSVWSIKTVVKLTRESIDTAAFDAESAFSNAITDRVGQLVDNALWAGGTATAGSPIGLFNMTGFTNAGTAAGTAITASTLVDMDASYRSVYADAASGVWAMSPASWAHVQKIDGDFLLQPALSEGAPERLLGKPVVVTKRAPDTAIALFDKNRLAVGRAPATVTILDQTYADYDVIGIRVTARYDVKPLDPTAIVKLTVS